MKIALVMERFSLTRGGAERSMYELGCCLGELGAEVTLVATQVDKNGLDYLPFKTVEEPVHSATAKSHWRRFEHVIAAHCAREKYDIVHSIAPLACADIYQPRGGSVLYGAKRHFAAYESNTIAFLKQATSGFNRRRSVQVRAERKLCAKANGPVIAGLSEYVVGQFKTLYGLNDERARVIRNGVRIEKLRSEEVRTQGEKLRKLYDPQGTKTIFVYAAENYHLKGLAWLLRSAARAVKLTADRQDDFQIMVFGQNDYGRYYKQAQRLGLEGHVIFMGQTYQMPGVLQMCDAVVLPSYNDACSRTILEGLAAGKPGITTVFNGACEFLKGGKYGIVIERCGDVESLGGALARLCDKSQRQQMSAAIEDDRVYEQVSMVRHARELMALYRDRARSTI